MGASTADFYTIQPTFTIKDLAKAEPFMKKCVDLSRTEAGCMYYGWTIQGDKLFCREAYVDAAAVQAHLENIGAAVGEMLDSGAASLDKIEFHGPKEGWPTFKKTADGFGDPAHVYDQGPGQGGALHEEVRRPHPHGGRLHVLRLDDPGRQALLPRGLRRREGR